MFLSVFIYLFIYFLIHQDKLIDSKSCNRVGKLKFGYVVHKSKITFHTGLLERWGPKKVDAFPKKFYPANLTFDDDE